MCIRDRAYTVRETLEEVIELTGYVKELEAEKTEEAQARIEKDVYKRQRERWMRWWDSSTS